MIKLHAPSIILCPSYLEFVEEMRTAGERIWENFLPRISEAPEAFVERLVRAETGPEPGLIAESTYWAVRNHQVVGRISLRHALNENLKEFGGHIGYEVRPSARKKGVASEMLKLVLQTTKA